MQPMTKQFEEFCLSKGNEEYDFLNTGRCAFAQFLIAAGYSDDPRVAGDGWVDNEGRDHPLPFPEEPLLREPWTFSALADRLREIQP
jgi:hypothetical protein